MRGIANPLGHLVGDDAYALALSELLLREGTSADKRQFVEVEETGVGAQGISGSFMLLRLIANNQEGIIDASSGLNALQPSERKAFPNCRSLSRSVR